MRAVLRFLHQFSISKARDPLRAQPGSHLFHVGSLRRRHGDDVPLSGYCGPVAHVGSASP